MLGPCWLKLLILAALLESFTAAFTLTARPFGFRPPICIEKQALIGLKTHKLPMTASGNNNDDKDDNVVLEVEQKFALLDGANLTAVEEKLTEMGMERKGDVQMVDWYYDLPAPHWVLTPKDFWLRYREVQGKGEWQLKRGRRHEGGATVYEEIEGPEAVKVCMAMLPPDYEDSTVQPEEEEEEEFDDFSLPQLPSQYDDCGIVPFARIETRRSSWCLPKEDETSPLQGLTVDLDGTNFNYMVGEVEAVVSEEKEIENVRRRIEELISQLTPSRSCDSGAAYGKLEFYLMTRKPDHYKVCVQTGSIVPKRGSQNPIVIEG